MEGCDGGDRVPVLRALEKDLAVVLHELERSDLEGATTAEARCRRHIARLEADGSGAGGGEEERALLRALCLMNGRVLATLGAARDETARSMRLLREERASLEVYRVRPPLPTRSSGLVA